MKTWKWWMVYILIAFAVGAHYGLQYLDLSEQVERDKMNFMLEMAKTHPVFIHPLQGEDK